MMPLYNYVCMDCLTWDPRIGGLDDHTGVCHLCTGMMLRSDDPFEPTGLEQTGSGPSGAGFQPVVLKKKEKPPCAES
jgi:hypothetical protein